MVPPEACDLKLNHRIPTPTVQIDALSSRSRGHSEALRNKIGMTFGIRLEMAERTLHVTTQLALCQTINPLHQWFHTEVAQLQHPRLGGTHGRFHTDTFFASQPSLSWCMMGQLYTNDIHFTKFPPSLPCNGKVMSRIHSFSLCKKMAFRPSYTYPGQDGRDALQV